MIHVADYYPAYNGLFHLIGFMSKSFSNTERNYQIHDKEMLVIMCALEEWRHFLKGSDQKFEIHTDHVRVRPRLGAYMMSRYLRSSDVSMRGHSRGMGPC